MVGMEPRGKADAVLAAKVTAVVAKCYTAGSYLHVDYKEVAPYAIRRWRTSARRDVPQDDRERRIYDLAKGLASIKLRTRSSPLPAHVKVAEAIADCLMK